MQPQQPIPPRQPVVDPYGFILSPQKPAETRKLPGPKDPFLRKLLFLIGGGALLLIIVVILFSTFFSPKGNREQLITLTQEQQEIIRLSQAYGTTLNNKTTKNFAANATASLASQQRQLTAVLSKSGKKLDQKVLALKKDPQNDTQLLAAQSSNTLDIVYTQLMQAQLKTYFTDINSTIKITTNKDTLAVLQTMQKTAQLLYEQLGQDQPTTGALY